MKRLPIILLAMPMWLLIGQIPFLEIRPYAIPDFIQYDIKNHVDHHYPTANITDGNFRRFDGVNLTENLMFPECNQGLPVMMATRELIITCQQVPRS